MAQDNKSMRYTVTTHTSFSHNYLIGILSSNDAQYQYDDRQTEQSYSRFQIISDINVFNQLRELAIENNGTSITIEYGTF